MQYLMSPQVFGQSACTGTNAVIAESVGLGEDGDLSRLCAGVETLAH